MIDYDAPSKVSWCKDGLEEFVVGDDFVVSNNFVYLTHRKVINLLLDLHAEWNSQHMGSQNGVLKALKKMKYVNSSNILKGIYYPFLSSTKFAAKLQNQR